jgi:hypothetical protein
MIFQFFFIYEKDKIDTISTYVYIYYRTKLTVSEENDIFSRCYVLI